MSLSSTFTEITFASDCSDRDTGIQIAFGRYHTQTGVSWGFAIQPNERGQAVLDTRMGGVAQACQDHGLPVSVEKSDYAHDDRWHICGDIASLATAIEQRRVMPFCKMFFLKYVILTQLEELQKEYDAEARHE